MHLSNTVLTLHISQVASAPPGTQAATLDIEAAYRTIPVWPQHKRFLVVEVDGKLFIDHVFPFGLATAGGVQGHVANATVDILHSLELGPIKKWVDDHTFFRFAISGGLLLPDGSLSPFAYKHGLLKILSLSKPLGVPWHPKKCCDFAFIFVYLGFLWDLTQRSVALPDKKRTKYQIKLTALLDSLNKGKGISLKDAMSINSTLSHVAFVIPHGHVYLANLCTFIASFPSNPKFAKCHPPPSVKTDLNWWLNTLSLPSNACTLSPHGPPKDLDLWVDASMEWGIGITLGNRWNAWTLNQGWKGSGRDIRWLEAIAVELAARTLFDQGMSNTTVIIHLDNQGVIGAFKHGWSRNFHVNLCIRRVEALTMISNIFHTLIYTESAQNKADPISHGKIGSLSSRLPSTELPSELVNFISPYVQ
jgi:hypothetical protein